MYVVVDIKKNPINFAGDWHCAYVLLYGPRILEIEDDDDGDKDIDTTKEPAAMETEASSS